MPRAKTAKEIKAMQDSAQPMSLEELFKPTTDEEILRARLERLAQEQCKTSMEYKRPRMEEVAKSIALYDGKTRKALKGRWNVPLPLMSGYVDTLLSKVDDAPKVKFGYQDIADMRRAAKVQAKWEQDSDAVAERWPEKDRLEKKIATFYGVGVSKLFAYNDEKGAYRSHYEVVDPLDFECEPMGGQDLSKHQFKGQRNIFKTKADLLAGATGTSPLYDKKQVLRLMAAVNSSDYKTFSKIYQEKTDRLKSLGFNPEQHSYVGIPVFNMTEWYMKHPDTGEDYYLFMDMTSGIAITCVPLKDRFESETDPFEAWHTHPDAFNFWSKAPADDMRPVAEAMNVIFNQALDNRDKKNYVQRAYDPAVFPDPSELEWRPDGLVAVAEGTSALNGGIGGGVYSFKVDDMPEQGTINLMKFMDDLTGLKTGVSASAQGATDDKLVGIYYGNLQQVADRLGLYNKSYSECWGRKGLKYYWGLREHIQTNKLMVRMLGDKGYNWEELVKDDTEPVREFNITIVGGQAEAQQDEILKKTKSAALASLIASPVFSPRLNPDVTIEEVLRNGGWEDAAIKRLMDTNGAESEEMLSRAHQAIQDILEGREPKPFRRVTTLYIQTIYDYLEEASDMEDAMWKKIFDYAQSQVEQATYNAVIKARTLAALAAPAPGAPQGPQAPVPGQGGGIPTPQAPVSPNASVEVPGTPGGMSEALGFSDVAVTPAGAKAAAA
jgi:hypothetical protein